MTDHVVDTVEELRSSSGEPSERAVRKSLDRLDRHCRRFIELSPFVVLATRPEPAGASTARRAATPPGSSQFSTIAPFCCRTGSATTAWIR